MKRREFLLTEPASHHLFRPSGLLGKSKQDLGGHATDLGYKVIDKYWLEAGW
jgi:hypothetical protein